jgi:hypothetical protein
MDHIATIEWEASFFLGLYGNILMGLLANVELEAKKFLRLVLEIIVNWSISVL